MSNGIVTLGIPRNWTTTLVLADECTVDLNEYGDPILTHTASGRVWTRNASCKILRRGINYEIQVVA